MNFSSGMLEAVLNGLKTQTRRPFKPGEKARIEIDGDDYGMSQTIVAVYTPAGRLKWQIGKTYAVCPGRGLPAVARIKLLEIRWDRPIDISAADALAEGFSSPAAFHDKLRALYGKNVNLEAVYWALTFKLVEGGAKCN